MKQRIYLVVERADGRQSTAEIHGDPVTEPMLEAAEDLLETLTTGERPPIKGLYDLCATAFGTTRENAKKRLLAAMYGKKSNSGLRAAVKTIDRPWPPLHNIPAKKKP